MKKVGRNDPCPCGSGKKYKKCCLLSGTLQAPSPNIPISPSNITAQSSSVEPYLDLVPSIVWNSHRWRAIFNRLHYRPIPETFHEFLVNVIKWTFGEKWWKHQIKMSPDDRHAVVNWTCVLSDFQRVHTNDEHKEEDGFTYVADAPSPVWSLLSLGYDLFCLQAKDQLPRFLIEKLKKHREFQSARYEIAVAAIMARSGFTIDHLDKISVHEKHCEFIATHKETGLRIGVEAKSRVRPGVLHEKGDFSYVEDRDGILDLIRRARKQKPVGLPFITFIDVNLPPSPGVPLNEKNWFVDLKRVLDVLEKPSPENPDPFTAIILTNYSNHYGSIDVKTSPGESGLILSLYPQNPLTNLHLIDVIMETLKRYDRIPDEV